MQINYKKLIEDSLSLAKKMSSDNKEYKGIFGIPNGGIPVALTISNFLQLPILSVKEMEDAFEKKETNILIVDDLVDSGKTLEKYKEYDTAVLYKKPSSPEPTYFLENIDQEWISLPHEGKDSGIDDHITRIIEYIGEDPKREGLLETPKRVRKSYDRLFGGYKQKAEDVLKVFDGDDYDQMVWLTDIEFYSTCEHHMIPFIGKCHIAYIPNGKVIGVSKLARLVEVYARRLQIQERLTTQVAEKLQEMLNAKGVAVVMEAQHLCMKARGVEKQNAIMKTAHLTGVFKDNENNARSEFYSLIK